MRTSDTLTEAEIDAFAVKLKATAAAAAQAQAIMRVVTGLETIPSSKAIPPQAPRRSATKPAAKSIPPAATQQALSKPASKAPAKRAHASGKRRPGIVPATVLAVLVGAKDGLALGAIADKLGGAKEKGRVAAALRKLRDEGRSKVVGDKQTAKWFAT